MLLSEATDLLRRGEADACACVFCEVISPSAGKMIQTLTAASASAFFLEREAVKRAAH
jgi:hypothetical protein